MVRRLKLGTRARARTLECMIVRRTFRPHKIVPYVWREVTFVTVAATLTATLVEMFGPRAVALPFAPLGVLGTALAIFLGFRSTQSYARWWEARTLWGGVVNQSRILARLVISAGHQAVATGKGGGAEGVTTYVRAMVYRQIAFAVLLRQHLRRQRDMSELAPLLSPIELARIETAENQPTILLQLQGDQLKYGVRAELVGAFDPISMEPALAVLQSAQGSCERIKDTPMPRQYDFFTRLVLWIFLALLPASLAEAFAVGPGSWALVPVSVLVGLVYATVNRAAQVIEDPFENKLQDVPMTALCRDIERDLRELLGESPVPPPLQPVDGYLL